MIPFQFNIDIIDELEKAFPSFDLIAPQFVVSELKGLSKNKKSKIRVNATLALKIINSPSIKIKNIPLKENESVDDALIRISKILATNDIQLKKRAKEKEIVVAYLRQKRYISIDGML